MSKPTESELAILQVLWANGPTTVRQVNAALNAASEKEIGYTTTLKLMQLMVDKSLLQRDTSQRTHVYTAAVEEQSTKRGLLNRFLTQTFQGSAGALVLEALGQHRASDAELAEIKALIERMETEEKQ
ncbi:MAG: BlaI/MecI/CopY family transcriptional regulator [Bacteroidota bacterium]